MFGLFSRRKRDEASYQFQQTGFHGDHYLLALVDALVTRERIDCFVETFVVIRLADLDGRTDDDVGTVTFEHCRQVRSLRRRTRDDNGSSLEWFFIHG